MDAPHTDEHALRAEIPWVAAPHDGGPKLDVEGEMEADPLAGREIGTCEIVRRLSTSAFLGLSVDDVPVVLKRVRGEVQELFTRADRLAAVTHPCLARVFGLEVTGEELYWVTEFIPGVTLQEICEACRHKGVAVPLGVSLAAVHEAALGLDALVGGLGRGTFTPDDLLETFSGGTRLLSAGPASRDPLALDLRGARWGVRADLFSLGSVLYQCLCGKPPHGEVPGGPIAPPSKLNLTVPQEVDAVVLRALQSPGTEPLESAQQFALALQKAGGDFMWRPGQRAEFVTGLFLTRWRKIQVLIAGLDLPAEPPPLPPKKKSSSFRPFAAVLQKVLELKRSLPPPLPLEVGTEDLVVEREFPTTEVRAPPTRVMLLPRRLPRGAGRSRRRKPRGHPALASLLAVLAIAAFSLEWVPDRQVDAGFKAAARWVAVTERRVQDRVAGALDRARPKR